MMGKLACLRRISGRFGLGLVLACLMLAAAPIHAAHASPSSARYEQRFLLSPIDANLWDALKYDFQLSIPTEKPAIQSQIHWYVKHKAYLNKIIERAAPYIFYIYQQTQKRDLPAELALLPFIESEYNPFAYSHAGATGLWQMMPGTATGFGVKIDWWYDGRRDVIASTQAALDYLSYLHDFLGSDWLLAIAAYNSGEGSVRQAVKKNIQHHRGIDFWSLNLPKETTAYVPKLLALISIIQNAEQYGIQLPILNNTAYFKPVNIGTQIDFKRASKLSHLDIKTLHRLNPGFRRWATDPEGPFTLLVPIEKAAYFKKQLTTPTNNPIKTVTWYRHLVKTGDTLSDIAHHHHTTVTAIQASNHLSHPVIHPGKILLVPNTLSQQFIQHTTIKRNAINEDRLPGPKAVIHIVKKNESLEHVAKQHHATIGQILFWNQLTYQHKPKPGTKLVLWKRSKHIGYTVKSGDSLSTIAHRYHITMKQLKQENHLKTNTILTGQSLMVRRAS